MGLTKASVTARLDAPNVQHVFSVCLSRWPHLSVSAAVNLIVAEHLAETQKRQRNLCLQKRERYLADSLRGETGEGSEKVCTGSRDGS